MTEGTDRMIKAGWEIYTGKCPPPESMNGYEFNIMDGVVFKKLKKCETCQKEPVKSAKKK